MDLQLDFLDQAEGRMPVTEIGADLVIEIANQVLDGNLLPNSLPVLILNQFPESDRIGNWLRHRSALAGSRGAALDTRIRNAKGVPVVEKCHPSAFSNHTLDALLRGQGTREIYLLGVFAEGCVRATAIDALRRGYKVRPITDAIASNANWKKQLALWAMKRAGAVPMDSRTLMK
jgi:nicotinamidase-related amidase